MKGNHSRKTAAFVRACVAYCFITIPSLVGIFTRLNLYLHSGQVALANQCLSQADAFFKAAIGLVPEVPKTISIDGKLRPSEPFLLEFLCNFFSTLLIVPDHPEHGVLFLVRELLNVIQDYTWEDSSDDKIRIYTSVLHLLSAMSQDTYLYHIDKGSSIPASPQHAPISRTAQGPSHHLLCLCAHELPGRTCVSAGRGPAWPWESS